MACTCFSNPCYCGGGDCVTDIVQDCEHVDPGLETSGAHLPVLDYLFNERRLQNAVGVLTCNLTGAGYRISFSTAPNILYDALSLPLNTTFTGLVVSTGSAGANRRLVPTAEGFMRANADGTFQTVLLPSATVPDPLVLTTLSATNGNITSLTVSGLPIFSGLAADTITQNIGLNAANHLVTGTVAHGSVAKFHENVVETDGTRPNAGAVAGDYIKFTNEISDADAIASTVNNQKIKIDVAGTYEIRWGVGFGRHTDQNSAHNWRPVVGLEYNGAIVSYGDNPDGTYSKDSALTATGTFVGALAINDFFQLKLTGTDMPANGTGTASGISGSNMVLTRIK